MKKGDIIMTEAELLEIGYRKYDGQEVDVFFNKDICTHSQNCIKGNASVFDLERRPWILPDGAATSEVMEVIDRCPSGALKYRHPEEG